MRIFSPPATVTLGVPKGQISIDVEEEELRQIRFARRFAMSTTEVSKDQFHDYQSPVKVDAKYNFAKGAPMSNVSWHRAAQYCNELSRRQGIPPDEWCYFADGDRAYVRPDHLSKRGFRLPTEWEWEYAARGGTTTTTYHCGDLPDLLTKYEWYVRSNFAKVYEEPPVYECLMPVGELLPNQYGMFDMLGNAQEWCANYAGPLRELPSFPDVIDDDQFLPEFFVRADMDMRNRGGKYWSPGIHVRPVSKSYDRAKYGFEYVGFRVVQTLAPEIAPD